MFGIRTTNRSGGTLPPNPDDDYYQTKISFKFIIDMGSQILGVVYV